MFISNDEDKSNYIEPNENETMNRNIDIDEHPQQAPVYNSNKSINNNVELKNSSEHNSKKNLENIENNKLTSRSGFDNKLNVSHDRSSHDSEANKKLIKGYEKKLSNDPFIRGKSYG